MLNFSRFHRKFEYARPHLQVGKILRTRGDLYDIFLPRASVGSLLEFINSKGERSLGEVISINKEIVTAMCYEELVGINSDTQVFLKGKASSLELNENYLGRVVDFLGRPIDGLGPIEGEVEEVEQWPAPLNPLQRPMIKDSLDVGVHAINGFTTIGKGQRMAILAGSGVGKSVLLGMMAKKTVADINVVALIGERGREVLEFIRNDLGEEGLRKSVIVVATSDCSPLVRMKAAYTATAISEYFRDKQNDVLLMMDSITRFAMAGREISLAAGEPPGQKGYTPSIFAKLSKLMERAGTKTGAGSITGLYTVLVEGGDTDEPISDAVRAISDGHIVLSRELAAKNIYPAIDILNSLSRVMSKVVKNEFRVVSGHLRDLLSEYRENEDLINVGAYSPGSNPKLDKAIRIYDDLMSLLKQDLLSEDSLSPEEVYDHMVAIARKAENIIEEE